MSRKVWTMLLAVALLVAVSPATAFAGSPADEFGAVKSLSLEQAKIKSLAWLKGVKADPATVQKAEAIWNAQSDLSVLDRVAETFMLGDKGVKELLETARDANAPAPTQVPEQVVSGDQPMFFKANVGLYFAKQMAAKKVYEEALATLKAFGAEDTVEPSTYYFFHAVAANKLRFKKEAEANIAKMMDNPAELPERYAVVSALMQLEMSQWKDSDLGDIARRMKEVEDRLEIARGGKTTQVKQDDIVAMLDKMIKQLEKECEGCKECAGAGAPKGIKSSSPAKDSAPAQGEGQGNVDAKALVKDMKLWGKLPEKERIQAFEAIKKEYPPHITEAIRGFLVKGQMLPEGVK